jgi:hypothetical protein
VEEVDTSGRNIMKTIINCLVVLSIVAIVVGLAIPAT